MSETKEIEAAVDAFLEKGSGTFTEKLKNLSDALEKGGYAIPPPEKIVEQSALHVEQIFEKYAPAFSEKARAALAIPSKTTFDRKAQTMCVFSSITVTKPEITSAVAKIISMVNELAERGWIKSALAPLGQIQLAHVEPGPNGHTLAPIMDLSRRCVSCDWNETILQTIKKSAEIPPCPCPGENIPARQLAVFSFFHVPVSIAGLIQRVSEGLLTSEGEIGKSLAELPDVDWKEAMDRVELVREEAERLHAAEEAERQKMMKEVEDRFGIPLVVVVPKVDQAE